MALKVVVRASAACLLLASLAGCSAHDAAPAVATATFTPSRTRVALGSPVDLTYKFDVLPGAVINGDYTVFVHVVSDDGQQIWGDDHQPPVPTSQWKPGQTIGPYTHTKFAASYPYTGHASVIIGLYKIGTPDRLTLTSADPKGRLAAKHEYKVGDLEIIPSAENVRLIMMSGWHAMESAPNDPLLDWQWTQKSAAATFANPRKDVTLYLESDSRLDAFPTPPNVTISVAGQPVFTFAAGNSKPELRRIPITAAQLGTKDMVDLRIDLDKTFVPAKLPGGGTDIRELGLRVYHLFIEPK